jgi:flagellin-like protein
MKGVSEIIAIILILMIVIALAALAYTWFSGIFATLTGTASTSITQTTTQMTYQFTLENSKCADVGCAAGTRDCIRASIRNTGSGTTIDVTKVTAYVGGVKKSITNIADTSLTFGESTTFDVGDTVTASEQVSCPTPPATGGDLGKGLSVTIETGLEQSKIITS